MNEHTMQNTTEYTDVTTSFKSNSDVRFFELVEGAKRIAIFPSKIAGKDAFSAGVGLYHMLKEKGKDVSFVYTGQLPDGCADLIAPEDVTADIAERELMVSIDYSNTPAAKVHYSTEKDVLYLKVRPIDKNFDLSRVGASIKGFDYDLILAVGAQELGDFGQVYTDLAQEFAGSQIINIDNVQKNTKFGLVNIIDEYADSLSLLVLQKSNFWDLKINKKAAKALLTGVLCRNVE